MRRSDRAVALSLALACGARAAVAAPPGEAVQQARARWAEGVAAYDAGRWEAARVAFAQVWALEHHPAVLRNLGQAELKLERWVDAARHISRFVDEGTPSDEDRASAERSLAEANAHVGRLAIEVAVAGAEVRVDGDAVGTAPIRGAWIVEPGRHVVRASHDGWREQAVQVEVAAGAIARVQVALVPIDPAYIASAPAAASSTPATPSRGAPAPDAPAPGPSAAIVVAGAAASVVAAGVAVGFARATSSDASVWATTRDALAPSACARDDGACADLEAARARYDRDRAVAIAAGIASGAFAAATLTYALWPRARAEAPRAGAWVAPGAAGASLGGTF